MPEPAGHPACRPGAEPRRGRPPAQARSFRAAAARGVVAACSRPATFPARTTSRGVGKNEPLFARRPGRVCRPAAGDGGGRHARRRPRRRRARGDRDRAGRGDPRHRDGAGQAGLCAGAVDHPARRSRCGAEVGAAQAERGVQRRRPGAFLSRRPDRLRPAGRGWRPRRAFLDPASDRGPAYLRRDPGLRLQPGHRGGAPPGRRLRRQGEQRLVGRRRGGAGRGQDRPAGEAPPAARDRHDRDRQAPSASTIATRWASTTRAACWRSTRCWRPMPAGAST